MMDDTPDWRVHPTPEEPPLVTPGPYVRPCAFAVTLYAIGVVILALILLWGCA